MTGLDPRALPDHEPLRRRCQALAMLDAIVCRDWDNRYYSFNASWGAGEQMASMRNGSGDDWFILFAAWGTAIKGLDHENAHAQGKAMPAAVQRVVPRACASFLDEPAFGMHWISYCYWRERDDAAWRQVLHPDAALVAVDDGSLERLAPLCGPAQVYAEFANWYYELELPLAAIAAIYAHAPLVADLIRALAPGLVLAELREDAEGIGYPLGAG